MKTKKIMIITLVLLVIIISATIAGVYAYGYYNKVLTPEEFMTRMETIGYTGNANGSVRESDDPTYAVMYVAMGNRDTGAQYSRIQLDVFGEKRDAKESYKSWTAYYIERSDSLEVVEKSSTRFIAFADDRCILFSRVQNTVLSAVIPKSDYEKLKAALIETSYIPD